MVDPSKLSIVYETHQKEIKELTEKHQEQLAALRHECVQTCRAFTALHKAADEEKDELIRQREAELLDGYIKDVDYLRKAFEQEEEAQRVEKFIKFLAKADRQRNNTEAEPGNDPEAETESNSESDLPDIVLQLLCKLYKEMQQLRNEQVERRESLVCQKHVLAEKSRNAKLQRQNEILRVAVEAAKIVPGETEKLREQVKELETSKIELERKLAVETEKAEGLQANLENLEKSSDGAIAFFKQRHIEQKCEIMSHLKRVKELEAQLEGKKEAEESLRNVCARFQFKLDATKRLKREEIDELKESVKKRDGQVKRLEKKLRVAGNAISSLKKRKELLEHVDFQQVRRMLKEICEEESNSKSMSTSKRGRPAKKSHLHCVKIFERMLIRQVKNGDFQQKTPNYNEELLERMYRKVEELARNTEQLARGDEEVKPPTTL